jgi:hypothetical protein
MAIADERHVCKGCRFLCVDAGQFALHSALYAVGECSTRISCCKVPLPQLRFPAMCPWAFVFFSFHVTVFQCSAGSMALLQRVLFSDPVTGS